MGGMGSLWSTGTGYSLFSQQLYLSRFVDLALGQAVITSWTDPQEQGPWVSSFVQLTGVTTGKGGQVSAGKSKHASQMVITTFCARWARNVQDEGGWGVSNGTPVLPARAPGRGRRGAGWLIALVTPHARRDLHST